MVSVALDKKNLKKFIMAMLKQGQLRGPVKDSQGVVLGDVTAKSELVLEYANFKLPLKREFFPQCEVISRYDANGLREETVNDESIVMFGVRPCDAQSLVHLDKVFSDEQYTDPYYQKRRDNSLVISLACKTPASECFCSSTGGGPYDKAGADIMSVDLGNSLFFEAVSAKGEAFLTKNKGLFRPPTSKETQQRKRQESDSIKQQPELRISDIPKMLQNATDPLFWDSLAETCLGCGACTFLCPTCHCFDFFEEKQERGGKRLRVHDACMFASFTREASGHNPRSGRGERMRQRIMHKFSYAQENYGRIFCVGCGRCVVNCPSNIDIRETLSRVNA